MDFESSGCAFDPRRGRLACMSDLRPDLQLIRILTERLERISADSVWAHRASGVRGALLRTLDQLQTGNPPDARSFDEVVSIAFHILAQAAKRR